MKKQFTNIYPAKSWNEATPLGNGRVGASVYGCRYDERILINHESLFNYAGGVDFPNVSYALPIVRGLMDEGKYAEAEVYYTNEIKTAMLLCNINDLSPKRENTILQWIFI